MLSQLAVMLSHMIHETLTKKNLEGTLTDPSSQTLNSSSNYLSQLAAWSTQGLNNSHVEIRDPSLSGVSDDLTIPAGHWEASEGLSSFLDFMFSGKPLSVHDRIQTTKDFSSQCGVTIYSSA